jgi:SAM-dependent methyltransferase
MAQVGGRDYRAYVGPAERYDLMSSSQFSLLCALGLRESHRLLDIGCGSLRGGRLFIPYLAPGGYTGLEPNRWLVEEGIEKHLGRDALTVKEPTFIYNDSFDASGLDPFDFVLAQSIASHAGPAMTRALFEAVRRALAPVGVAAVSIRHGRSDWAEEGWFYAPGGTVWVRYRRQTIERWLDAAGLQGSPLAWFHPGQTWWAIVHAGAPLPPHLLRLQARGAMLPFARSWDVRHRLLHRAARAAMLPFPRSWDGRHRLLRRAFRAAKPLRPRR